MSEQDSGTHDQPATAPVNAETPEQVTEAKPEETTQAEPRTFTQEELDAIVQKEKAKAESKAERRVMKTLEKLIPQRQEPVRQERVDDKPSRAQYADDETYVDALTDWKLDQRDKASHQQKASQQQKEILDKSESIYAEAAKDSGFDREEFDALPITPMIAQVIMDSDAAAKLMVFMAANPAEVDRIAALSPARQAAELGKIEDRLSKEPQKSKAPAPINPIGRGNTVVTNLANASPEEYAKLRAKQGARWAR